MKSIAPLVILSFLTGCSVTAWKDTGQQGPWCAPGVRAHVVYRTVNSIGLPNPQGELALEGKSGIKRSEWSFYHELDSYFANCTFINQWPVHGTVNSILSHELSFDLCLVSINPTVIIGAERQDPKVSSFWPLDKSPYSFISCSSLADPIAVRTTIPYHPGANIFWFSPDIDHDLHQLDLVPGTVSFAISKSEQIVVVVAGAELTTSRK